MQHVREAGLHVSLTPFAVTEQDQAGGLSPGKCEQARIVEVGRNDYPVVAHRAGKNIDVGGAKELQFGGMHCIMPRRS